MTFIVQPESPPLHEDPTGALRVGNSRVLLELVIQAFQDGATPETILQRYPTLSLSDIYAVVAYYLRHPNEIDDYLTRRENQAVEMQQHAKNTQPDLSTMRARLLAQRNRG
jgi:uncharacterized protein (DUF433 family)